MQKMGKGKCNTCGADGVMLYAKEGTNAKPPEKIIVGGKEFVASPSADDSGCFDCLYPNASAEQGIRGLWDQLIGD